MCYHGGSPGVLCVVGGLVGRLGMSVVSDGRRQGGG